MRKIVPMRHYTLQSWQMQAHDDHKIYGIGKFVVVCISFSCVLLYASFRPCQELFSRDKPLVAKKQHTQKIFKKPLTRPKII